MPAILDLPKDASAGTARRLLSGAGWREVGAGDWSWALADPEEERVARVTPFDPAFRLFAEDCLHGPQNRWLPRVHEIVPLRRDGYVVVMERLWPAEESAAAAFCSALAIANDSGYDPPAVAAFAEDRDLDALRDRIRALLALGAGRYRLWGGSDIRPGNVMASGNGDLKLIDPIFVAGKRIIEALQAGDRAALGDFTRTQLEDFLTIPALERGSESERDAFRVRIAELKRGAA